MKHLIMIITVLALTAVAGNGLAGGGDTISAIKIAKAEDSFSYISNAGGAFLEWFQGNELPGIKAIKENRLF